MQANPTGRQQRIDTCLTIEGMTSAAGLALMDVFIEEALRRCGSGSFVEFGTYKGRTAALFAQHLGADATLHAVEQADYLQIDRLRQISPRVQWHRLTSEAFCAGGLTDSLGGQRLVASHHDASHFFDNVATELRSMPALMATDGVIILDDFNDAFAQVRAAYYHLRYVEAFPYELLVIGFNKCVLVHQDRFDAWEALVLDRLLGGLRLAQLDCTLFRTDIHRHSRGFFVRTKAAPADADRYGTAFWGERFYQPSARVLTDRP
ncbi:MAG: class I SAM-dependent methyltransferase [Burkholderiaceae bacterium]|nr:class I SAM-dependent methyltransferase [Burkholderiaceae bacterium]